MDIINDVKNQIRTGYENTKSLFKTALKGVQLVGSGALALKDLSGYIKKNRPGKKAKNYFKNDTRAMEVLPNLSKQDLKELNKLSKEYNFQYSIVDNFGKNVHRNGTKEIADYKVVYSAKDAQIMAHAIKDLKKRRIERQLKKDPKDRTDFNKDGIIDEKDYDIASHKIKSEFEYGKEYGTQNFDSFKNEKLFSLEIEKDVFIEKQSIFVNTFSNYSAQFLKNNQGKDCMYITLSMSQKKTFEKLVKNGFFKESDFIRMEMNYEGLSKDADNQQMLHMDKKEYNQFIKKYSTIPYSSYEILNKKSEKEYMVTFNIQDAKKFYESDKNLKSINDIENIKVPEKNLNIVLDKDIEIEK